MERWIRGATHFPESTASASALWADIEKLVEDQTGGKPFADLALSTSVSKDYQPSRHLDSRFALVEGHRRYIRNQNFLTLETELGFALGPVELDLLDFVSSSNPAFLVLLGSMGSGKTTTIRFLKENFSADRTFLVCNCEASPVLRQQSDPHNLIEDVVAGELAGYLSKELNKLISAEEEIRQMWTWGLTVGSNDHSAANVLNDAQAELRNALDGDELSESVEAVVVRKRAREEIRKSPFKYLHYQALRLDYYLTFHCSGDRSRFLLILDNADPLTPAIQTQIFRLASSVQMSARCKMLVAFRPLTYSSNCQGSTRIVDVVEHAGPSIMDIIMRCIEQKILTCDLSKLTTKVREPGGTYRTVKEEEVRRWLVDILTTVGSGRTSGLPGDPNARSFIEGICGTSIRSSLTVAPKFFGSPVAPSLPSGESTGHSSRVRDHEIIRTIVDGWRGYYCADPYRVTHNLFDLGDRDSRSCTSKIRLLKKLSSSSRGISALGEVVQHLSGFGYSDKLILNTINDVMNNARLLAWSDSVHLYKTLDGHHNSRLQISTAGRYYIEHAMLNLEYVQGVHVDVLLPESETLRHDPRNFSDRLRSLEMFTRFLHRQELEEVKRMLISPLSDYIDVYGKNLFSLEIVEALTRQINSVGSSLLRNQRLGKDRADEVINTLSRWDFMSRTLSQESKPVVDKISLLN